MYDETFEYEKQFNITLPEKSSYHLTDGEFQSESLSKRALISDENKQ